VAHVDFTLTRAQVREVDRRAIEQYGLSGLVLMENAGRGVVEVLCRLAVAAPVVLCCGKGNNAGDGFVIARHLDLRGIRTQTLIFGDPAELRGDAAANFQVLSKAGLSWRRLDPDAEPSALRAELQAAGVIVDALLGTGAQGAPRPPLATVIELINASGRPVVAVDLPSGLDCDTGAASPHTIRAQHTCTFVAAKPGLLTPSAQHYVGELHIVDIGVPRKLIEELCSA